MSRKSNSHMSPARHIVAPSRTYCQQQQFLWEKVQPTSVQEKACRQWQSSQWRLYTWQDTFLVSRDDGTSIVPRKASLHCIRPDISASHRSSQKKEPFSRTLENVVLKLEWWWPSTSNWHCRRWVRTKLATHKKWHSPGEGVRQCGHPQGSHWQCWRWQQGAFSKRGDTFADR